MLMLFRAFIVFFLMSNFIFAQDQYSYISDRKFHDPADLIGFNFKPGSFEIPQKQAEEHFKAGEYSFGISTSNLYVKGPEIEGVYSINNTKPTDYGYKMLLMNARDPMIQGHLKMVLNQFDQVEALIFKRSNKEDEIIFFQAAIAKDDNEKDRNYFTDRFEIPIEDQDSLWGKQVVPFFRIHADRGKIQERLQASDSTVISFVEKITFEEKTKEKKIKEKKKKNDEGEEEIVEKTDKVIEEGSVELDSLERAEAIRTGSFSKTVMQDGKKVTIKVKVVKTYYIEVRSIVTYEDGEVLDEHESYQIASISEGENTRALKDEDRYQLQIDLTKGAPIFMYLTQKRTISRIDVGGKQYLMRGH